MKNYERHALLMFLCGALFICLLPRYAWSQSKNVVPTNSPVLAIFFPLQIADSLQFEGAISERTDVSAFLNTLGEAQKKPQSTAKGERFPEAVSLDALLTGSFRAKIQNIRIMNYDIDSLPSLTSAQEKIQSMFSSGELASSELVCFNMYEIIGDNVRFCSLLVRKDGAWAEYVSNSVSMFEMHSITDHAVDYFLQSGLMDKYTGFQSSDVSAQSAHTGKEILPVIEAWKTQKDYENAQRSFKFAIGGTAIGISLTFLSAGIWQMYREASYRNSAFTSAATISGVAAGACGAATAGFLTFSVLDAIKMLKASQ